MKTPMEELKEEIWRMPKEVSKRDVLILIEKMLKVEKRHIANAAIYGHNKYINEQLQNNYKQSNKSFGENYYNDLYQKTT
jgi:hypothetical protein